MVPISTAFVQARRTLGEACGRVEVAWAVAMLEVGREEESFAMLASVSPPYNAFELAPLRDRALADLGAAPVDPAEAPYVYVAEILRTALADGGDLDGAFDTIKQRYLDTQYDEGLFAFYQLVHARDALLAGQEQWDWPGATLDSVEGIMRHHAESFVRNVDARKLS